jgi:hypothetical protein
MTVLRIAAGAAPCLSRSLCKNLECVVRVLEIQMPNTLRKSTRSATKEGASSIPSDTELVPREDRRRVRRARRARPAARESSPRKFVDPTACERDLDAAELEFTQAMHEYKKRSGRMFPTWSEVLEVLTQLDPFKRRIWRI